jgi:hypothetical protein
MLEPIRESLREPMLEPIRESLGALALRVAAENMSMAPEFYHTKCVIAYVCRAPELCLGACTPEALYRLVRSGATRLRVVAWLLANGCYSEPGPAPRDESFRLKLWKAAASSGSTGILDALDSAGVRKCFVGQSRMWIAAAKADSPAVIAWLDARRCPRHADACAAAAGRGNLEALKALRNLSPPFHWTRMTTRAAAESRCSKVFKWALLRGCECDRDVWSHFRNRHDVLAWGLIHGFLERLSDLDPLR